AFVEQIVGDVLPAREAGEDALDGGGGLADARRAAEQGVGASNQAAAEQQIELLGSRGDDLLWEFSVMSGRDKALENGQTARVEFEVVIAATILDPAHLHDFQ